MAFHVGIGDVDRVTRFSELAAFDQVGYGELAVACFERGLWLAPRGIWYTSAAHGERELAAALERFDAAVAQYQEQRVPARAGA
jgi:glutamate-1-semialdehyde 2,1-aminomutase